VETEDLGTYPDIPSNEGLSVCLFVHWKLENVWTAWDKIFSIKSNWAYLENFKFYSLFSPGKVSPKETKFSICNSTEGTLQQRHQI